VRVVLVDSSVWTDFFNGRVTVGTEILKGLLGRRDVAIADVIAMEVLQGFRFEKDLRRAEWLFEDLVEYEIGGRERARLAARNYRRLRAMGVTPRSSIDVLIATFCVEEGVELLASDRDFALMAPHLGLLLHDPHMH
jgi:predicted nucleic acid-binding protein